MKNVILVDDDDEFRTMLRQTLKSLGYAVWEARDGAQAIHICEAEPPDLVLTDLVMPGMEGLETILMLRRKFPDVRIVAMSGNTHWQPAEMLQVARIMGARQVLEKPFTVMELDRALELALADPPPATVAGEGGRRAVRPAK